MSFKLTIGRVGFAARDLFPNEAIAWLSSTGPALNEEFLALWLEAQDLSQGSGRAVKGSTLNSDSLRAIPVMVPPIEVQQRIVDVVGAIDAHISNLQSEAAAASDVFEQLLDDALAGKLNGHDAKEWEETKLGEVARWGSGGTPRAGSPEFYEGGTIPWAVIADLRDSLLADTAKHLTSAGAALIGHLAPAGAVLVSMYGTIGRTAVAQVEMATNQAIAWGVADADRLEPLYLFYWLRNRQPILDSLGRGATQRNINREIIKGQELRLPPMVVQREVVDLVAAADDHARNLRAEVLVLQQKRAQVLNSLLSREVELPEAYDRLMVAGVA
jgi:type I restriction enzyme S subunit